MLQASPKLAAPNLLLARRPTLPPEPDQPSKPDFWHSPDYTEVRSGGQVYFHSRNQAAVIRLVHREHLRGRIDVPGAWLLRKVGCECTRMGEVFRFSASWGALLVFSPFRRGHYTLSPFVVLR